MRSRCKLGCVVAAILCCLLAGPGADAGQACRGNQCELLFQGLQNTALGNAILEINPNNELVVGNIGSSGLDGVSILHVPVGASTGGFAAESEFLGFSEWIELGKTGYRALGSGFLGNPFPAGAFLRNTARIFTDVEWEVLHTSLGGTIEITWSFNQPGGPPANTVRYEVYNGEGNLVASLPGQSGPALVLDWPTAQVWSNGGYAGQWDTPITINLPSGPPPEGDQLRIVPEGFGFEPDVVGTVELRLKDIPELIIVEETFGFISVPTLGQWGLIVLALLLGGSALYLLRRPR